MIMLHNVELICRPADWQRILDKASNICSYTHSFHFKTQWRINFLVIITKNCWTTGETNSSVFNKNVQYC